MSDEAASKPDLGAAARRLVRARIWLAERLRVGGAITGLALAALVRPAVKRLAPR